MTAPPPPHVVHVIGGLNIGGAERMLVKMCAATRDRFRHTIVNLLDDGPLAADARAAGAEVISLNLPRSLAAVAGARRLRRLLRDIRPDVVQGWMYHGNIAATLLLPWRARPPLLWNIRHTLGRLGDETRLTRLTVLAGGLFARRADRIIYNAHRSMAGHARFFYPPARGIVVPNGFDLEQFRPDPAARAAVRAEFGLPADAVLIGRVARDHAMKDHDTLFRAFARVRARYPAASLVLIGTGMTPDNATLHALARTCGVTGGVIWCGPRTDLPRLTAAFDVVVSSSSHGEAFPNIIGEAMACGVPAVATDVGDNLAILDDPQRIVPPKDPAALAAAILDLLDGGADIRQVLGQRDRERALAAYSLASVGDAYARIWASAAMGPHASGHEVERADDVRHSRIIRPAR